MSDSGVSTFLVPGESQIHITITAIAAGKAVLETGVSFRIIAVDRPADANPARQPLPSVARKATDAAMQSRLGGKVAQLELQSQPRVPHRALAFLLDELFRPLADNLQFLR